MTTKTFTLKMIEPIVKQTKKGDDYTLFEVTYKDAEGKTNSYKAMPFGLPAKKKVNSVLATLQTPILVDVDMEKEPGTDGKEYWAWTNVKPASEKPKAQDIPSTAQGYAAKPSGDEQDRQVLIVRQSSISSAVAFLASDKSGSGATADDVLQTAQRFEDFVFGRVTTGPKDNGRPEDMTEDDIDDLIPA